MNQIIIINTSGKTFQNVDLFKYSGAYKLRKLKAVDENKKFVNNLGVPDGRNYKWKKMHQSNRWDTNTTGWEDIKSDEITTKLKEKPKGTTGATGDGDGTTGVSGGGDDPYGAGGGRGY